MPYILKAVLAIFLLVCGPIGWILLVLWGMSMESEQRAATKKQKDEAALWAKMGASK